MAIHYNPTTVSDGLVLALDAANTRSYVGSGTTWIDLIGSNNGTLTNGPVFTQEPKQEPFGGAGAVEFDGTGDSLEVASSADFTLGTSGDFTIEGWVYPNSSHTSVILSTFTSWNTFANQWALVLSGTTLIWYRDDGDSGITDTLSMGQWSHIAVSRSGSTIYLFVNGLLAGTQTTNQNYTAQERLIIGSIPGLSDYNGKISNLRIIKGTALYTSNFTPPRKKLEVTSDTVLLTCEKGTIRDRSSSAHAITINGDAKSISGASYFEFDGTNAYVTIPDSDSFTFGSEDFTIECWIYPNSTGSFPSFISKYAGSSTNSSFFFSLGNANQTLEFYLHNGVSGQQAIIQAGTVSLSSWNHIVATRIGNQITTYLNGSVAGTQSWSYSVYDANVAVTVGAGQYNGGYYWNGNISNVRIYKGKGLTEDEVKRNFSALRGRYGI